MIDRKSYAASICATLAENPVCVLLGPRQCGKSTLAREIGSQRPSHYFDLEEESSRARLAEPEMALSRLEGLVILDEIQRLPSLFQILRVLADDATAKRRFLILGSASPDLVKGVSESLAGRVGFVDLSGFEMREVGVDRWKTLWTRGGFPRSYLAATDAASLRWRNNFVRTFLERDIPQLGIRIPPETLRRFWMMVAHYHGQIWNGSEPARSLGVSEHTVRRYLDILAGTYMVRILAPWFVNIGKRQYKAPKVYIRDSGILHGLLALRMGADVESHPKCGASWEGFALEQVLAATGGAEAFYWGTHAGAELDLVLMRRGKTFGVEFKYTLAPGMTKSLGVALEDLDLERAWIVYPGDEMFPVHPKVDALPLKQVPEILGPLGAEQDSVPSEA